MNALEPMAGFNLKAESPDANKSRGTVTELLLASWPEPEQMPETLLSVEPFDIALLPDSLQAWASDVINRVQCPPDFVAVTIMVSLGTVIGRRVGIRPKTRDDWTEYANLWGCVVGRPGVMKTPAMSAALGPLNALAAAAAKRFAEDEAEYGAEAQIHGMRIDAQKKTVSKELSKNAKAEVHIEELEPPESPVLKRYLINDATAEALLDICIDNPQGVCAYRDELVSMLKSLEREGQESARGFYLTGWGGNSSYTADRIGRGRNMRAEAVCLSLLGSTQPGRIAEYLRAATTGGASDDGLIQRFGMLVWPDVSAVWTNVDAWPDADAKRAAYEVFKRLDQQDPITEWGASPAVGHDGIEIEGEPPYLRLDPDAAGVFLEWRQTFETELRSGNMHPAMESHLAKYRKLVPSSALICHLADGGTGPVAYSAMVRSLAWAHYLKSHAVRAYGAVTVADVAGAKSLLKHIRGGDLSDKFTARDVYRRQWSMLNRPEDVTNAVAILCDYGWLKAVVEPTDGRSKTAYEINPKAFK